MDVKVKAITGFKASVEAAGASTTIKAIVSVENDKYANIENGSVCSNDETNKQLATFAHFGGINISYLTTDEDEIIAAITDVTKFVKYCKTNAVNLGTVSTEEAKEK